MTNGLTGPAANGASRGRWIWIASAVATAVVFVAAAATAAHVRKRLVYGPVSPFASTSTRTVTFGQPVDALDVHDYGGPAELSAGGAGAVHVTETLRYNGAAPRLQQAVAHGTLSLADPVCNGGRCSVVFQITVPAGTRARLETDGGAVTVTGLTAAVAAHSDGGPVTARALTGGLSAETGGGALMVSGDSGSLTAETGGGPVSATGVGATDVAISTGGGAASLGFTAVPRHVSADSGGGPVAVQLPGGTYAVSADSGGGPQDIGVADNLASPDRITVSSDGGAISIR